MLYVMQTFGGMEMPRAVLSIRLPGVGLLRQ